MTNKLVYHTTLIKKETIYIEGKL